MYVCIHKCMFECMHKYVVCMKGGLYVDRYVTICMYMYICSQVGRVYACMFPCKYVSIYVETYMNVCEYGCIYVCIYAGIYVYVCIHVYVFILYECMQVDRQQCSSLSIGHESLCTYVYSDTYTLHVCIYECIHKYICSQRYISVYVRMYIVYMYVYHIYAPTSLYTYLTSMNKNCYHFSNMSHKSIMLHGYIAPTFLYVFQNKTYCNIHFTCYCHVGASKNMPL